ncbi:MAG: hypothetical protein Kow0069_25710 [Promethearchaeota archaeon]
MEASRSASPAFPPDLQATWVPGSASFFFWFVPSPDTRNYEVELGVKLMDTFPVAWKTRFRPVGAKLVLPASILRHRVPQMGAFLKKFKRVDDQWVLALVRGQGVKVLDACALFASLPSGSVGVSPSVAAWADCVKLALELLSRQRAFPVLQGPVALEGPGGAGGAQRGWRASWRVSLESRRDEERFEASWRRMPPVAAAGVGLKAAKAAAGAAKVVSSFLDQLADEAFRAVVKPSDLEKLTRAELLPGGRPHQSRHESGSRKVPHHPEHDKYKKDLPPWDERLVAALFLPKKRGGGWFPELHHADRTVPGILERWLSPWTSARRHLGFRVAVELHAPSPGGNDGEKWRLTFSLRTTGSNGARLSAEEAWDAGNSTVFRDGTTFPRPRQALLLALGTLSKSFRPVDELLDEPRPSDVTLTWEQACQFLRDVAPGLDRLGVDLVLPLSMRPEGPDRLDVRLRLEFPEDLAAGPLIEGFDAFSLTRFSWEVAVGDQPLPPERVAELVDLNAPLVRLGSRWVYVDPTKASMARDVVEGAAAPNSTPQDALQGALSGQLALPGRGDPVKVVLNARLALMMEGLRASSEVARAGNVPGVGAVVSAEPPAGFNGELRPYQRAGLAWLSGLCSWGFGALLADDMGLGKTVQVIAHALARKERGETDGRVLLVVCPTSVLWNWEAEFARFAPGLRVVTYYGPRRPKTAKDLSSFLSGVDVAITTYGVVTREVSTLSEVTWDGVVVDEAQNVKNPRTQQARAVNSLKGKYRVALTGTPVENRLEELWSIFDFLNPGFLGTEAAFRKKFAMPIERFRDREATSLLRRLIGPFLLRRTKTDPAIVPDLPEKEESSVVVPLTAEQAALYQARVEATMEQIESSSGIQRRGLVLGLLTALKQICNHPAQFLKEEPSDGSFDPKSFERRSGKLPRLREMCEEVLANGQKVLLFTQYTRMARLLVRYLEASLRVPVLYLHGGVDGQRRAGLVEQFQEDPDNERPVFVISLRAGGTGLNLTRASYVVHFDRWWNPAVEDQATDRAYRIGQRRDVSVFKFVCRGTVEEKIDALIEEKKELAAKVVSGGEAALTELSDDELRQLFELRASLVDEGEEPPEVA